MHQAAMTSATAASEVAPSCITAARRRRAATRIGTRHRSIAPKMATTTESSARSFIGRQTVNAPHTGSTTTPLRDTSSPPATESTQRAPQTAHHARTATEEDDDRLAHPSVDGAPHASQTPRRARRRNENSHVGGPRACVEPPMSTGGSSESTARCRLPPRATARVVACAAASASRKASRPSKAAPSASTVITGEVDRASATQRGVGGPGPLASRVAGVGSPTASRLLQAHDTCRRSGPAPPTA